MHLFLLGLRDRRVDRGGGRGTAVRAVAGAPPVPPDGADDGSVALARPRLGSRCAPYGSREFDCHDGDVDLIADEVDTDRTTRITLEHRGCTPAAVAKLDGWMALGTPLLMMTDQGKVHLYGPDGAVTNLDPSGREGRDDPPHDRRGRRRGASRP